MGARDSQLSQTASDTMDKKQSVEELRLEIEGLKAENENLKKALQDKDNDIKRLKCNIQDIEKERGSHKEHEIVQKCELGHLREQLEKMTLVYSEESGQNRELEKRVKIAEEQAAKYSHQCDLQNVKLQASDKECTELTTKLEATKQDLDEVQRYKMKQKTDIMKLENVVEQLTEKNTAKQEDIQKYKTKVSKGKDTISRLKTEIGILKENILSYEKQIHETKTEIRINAESQNASSAHEQTKQLQILLTHQDRLVDKLNTRPNSAGRLDPRSSWGPSQMPEPPPPGYFLVEQDERRRKKASSVPENGCHALVLSQQIPGRHLAGNPPESKLDAEINPSHQDECDSDKEIKPPNQEEDTYASNLK